MNKTSNKFTINYNMADSDDYLCSNQRFRYKYHWPSKRSSRPSIQWYMEREINIGRAKPHRYFEKVPPNTIRAKFKEFYSRVEVKIEITKDYCFWL